MSVTIETIVNCDHCGETCSGDDRYMTAAKIRSTRRKFGWTQVGSGDYCPESDCVETAKAIRRIDRQIAVSSKMKGTPRSAQP